MTAAAASAAQAPMATPDAVPPPVARERHGHYEMRQCFASLPTRESPAAEFTMMWRRSTFGWTGGDVAYSRQLADGRTLWLFGDSFIGGYDGTARHDGPMVRNAFVIQDGRCLTTLRGGDARTLHALVSLPRPASGAARWYWPCDTLVLRHTLQVVLARVQADQSIGHRVGTDVARFSLPEFRLLSVRPVPTAQRLEWGATVLPAGAYTYVYGAAGDPLDRHLVLARVRGRDLGGRWTYLTAHGFSPDAGDAANLLDGVPNAFSVMPARVGYVLLTGAPLFDPAIRAYSGRRPQGPWAGPVTLGSFPRPGDDTLVYDGLAHREWTDRRGQVLLSTSVIGPTWKSLFDNPTYYMPQFVRVRPPAAMTPRVG